MAKIIALANQKGGVGKTTTSINLAASLVALDKKILIVDADPQANATSGLGFYESNFPNTYDLLIGSCTAQQAIQQSVDLPNLHIIASNINLVGGEKELGDMADGQFNLSKALQHVRDNYDYILIDCSPSLGFITLNALTAADSVMIPVQCEYFALEGLSKLLNTIRTVQERLNPNLAIEGFLFTMYDSRLRLANQVVSDVREHFGELVFNTIIQRNIRLSEAPSFGKPTILYDATSAGAVNYINLAKELLERNGQL